MFIEPISWYGVRAKCVVTDATVRSCGHDDALQFQTTIRIIVTSAQSRFSSMGEPVHGRTGPARGLFIGDVVNMMRSRSTVGGQWEHAIIATGCLELWTKAHHMDPRWFEYGWGMFKAVRGKQLAAMEQMADFRSGV